MTDAVRQFLEHARAAQAGGAWVKLTLGAPRGGDPTLRKVLVRPVDLRAGPRLSFVYRHDTRDLTKNLEPEAGFTLMGELLGRAFGSAHLFTTETEVELQVPASGEPRLRCRSQARAKAPPSRHDRSRHRLIDPREARWLHALGVTTREGGVCRGMEAKFRQINKFAEILHHQMGGLFPEGGALTLMDMGCGKGYLTFAAYDSLRRAGWEIRVRGVEAREDLVTLCNGVAKAGGFDGLSFEAGTIAGTDPANPDILVALHACDTATDDALAKGILAGASLILVAPCCHKELRPHLRPPPPLRGALRHGILLERQAEFVTDALRAALLEWAGYDTRVFEFISPEHTARNLMIAATKRVRPRPQGLLAAAVRDLAGHYGIASQHLAVRLGFPLAASGADPGGRVGTGRNLPERGAEPTGSGFGVPPSGSQGAMPPSA